MEREKFSSRWGFLLISAGCAIGLGNVEIPTLLENTAEQLCLFICFSWLSGLIMAMEFAVGRASQCCASSLRFWSRRKHWHINGYVGNVGKLPSHDVLHHHWRMDAFLLCQNGSRRVKVWMLRELAMPNGMLSQPGPMIFDDPVVVFSFGVCSMGLQKGVERVNKFMMTCLLLIMAVLAVRSCLYGRSSRRTCIYLKPDFER